MKKDIREKITKIVFFVLNPLFFHYFFRVLRNKLNLITYRKPPNTVIEFYKYCVDGIRDALKFEASGRLAILLEYYPDIRQPRTSKIVMINTEHTLVRDGGRGSGGSNFGSIPVVNSITNEKYRVRIPGGTKLMSQADQIIEYSIPNLVNVLQSEHKALYAQKSHYIAPLLSPNMLNIGTEGRDLSKAFTFMFLPEGGDRRSRIIENLTKSGISMANLSGLVGDASTHMSRMGILVNLHQTEHHHTLEELRILPALLQGVLVVSEPSPLIDKVPYSKFVTFASSEEMPGVILRLMDNYEESWANTFATGEFTKVVAELEESNKKAFKELVQNLKL